MYELFNIPSCVCVCMCVCVTIKYSYIAYISRGYLTIIKIIVYAIYIIQDLQYYFIVITNIVNY